MNPMDDSKKDFWVGVIVGLQIGLLIPLGIIIIGMIVFLR